MTWTGGTGVDHFALQLVTPPASEPLTIGDGSATDVKLWLRIDSGDTSQDALLATLISDARERFEEVTGRALMTQTWLYQLDRFPSWPLQIDRSGDYYRLGADADPRVIRLPRPPLQSVTQITYVPVISGAPPYSQTTLDATAYQVDANSEPGRLLAAYGTYWPVALVLLGAVQITFVAGFASASLVPRRYIRRLMAHVAHCFRERENPDDDYLDSLFVPFVIGGQG